MAGSARQKIYVVDSSSWISIEGNPAANRILYFLDEMIDRSEIEMPPEVWDELKRCEYVLNWLKPRHKKVVVRLRQKPEFLQMLGRVAFDFPAMSGSRGSKNKADPYVVAHAMYRKKQLSPVPCAVVCDETLRSRPNRKIPTACQANQIDTLRLMEMLKREYPQETW